MTQIDAKPEIKDDVSSPVNIKIDLIPDTVELINDLHSIVKSLQSTVADDRIRIKMTADNAGLITDVSQIIHHLNGGMYGVLPKLQIYLQADSVYSIIDNINREIASLPDSAIRKIAIGLNTADITADGVSVPIQLDADSKDKFMSSVKSVVAEAQSIIEPLNIRLSDISAEQIRSFIDASKQLPQQDETPKETESKSKKTSTKQTATREEIDAAKKYKSITKEIYKLKTQEIKANETKREALSGHIALLSEEQRELKALIKDSKLLQEITEDINNHHKKFTDSRKPYTDKYKKDFANYKSDTIEKYEDLVLDNRSGNDAQKHYAKELNTYLDKIKKRKDAIADRNIVEKADLDYSKRLLDNYIKSASHLEKILSNKNVVGYGSTYEDATNKMLLGNFDAGGKIVSSKMIDGKLVAKIADVHGKVKKVVFEVDHLTNAIVKAGKTAQKTSSAVDTFMSRLGDKYKEVARYLLSFGSLYEIWYIVQRGVQVLRDMDTAMVEVRKVSNETTETYAAFERQMADVAKQVATTNTELRNSAADWLRLGETIDDAATLAKNAAIYVNVGDGIDIDTATSDMIIAMRAFGIEASESMKIIDAYNEVGKLNCRNYIVIYN